MFALPQEREKRFMLPLDGLTVSEPEQSGLFSRKYAFQLFNPTTR